MKEKIICAGFGGQGIMLLGKVIARAALKENRQITWIPSYGAAMRGGCAFSSVVISDKEIASPYVDKCDTLFVFNQPSWDKFKTKVRRGGLVLLDATLIKDSSTPRHLKICRLPFTKTAASLGNVRVANMVALGAFLRIRESLQRRTVLEVFSEMVPKDKMHLLAINQKALDRGWQEKKHG